MKCAKIYAVKGVTDEELEKIKKHLINPVESEEVALEKPSTLARETLESADVKDVEGFVDMSDEEIGSLSMVYNIKADVKMDINATDSGVKIQYPSKLSKFPEIVGGNSPPPLQTA